MPKIVDADGSIRARLQTHIASEYRKRAAEHRDSARRKRALTDEIEEHHCERCLSDAVQHDTRAARAERLAAEWETGQRTLPDLDLEDPVSILRFFGTLPGDSMTTYVVRTDLGLTPELFYFAFNGAPVGTTVYLSGNKPEEKHLATRVSNGWSCPTLPPSHGYTATFCSWFWEGAHAVEYTTRLPGVEDGRPQILTGEEAAVMDTDVA